ncbi:hypothetical protein Glove_283g111 [Diversispora epigaea]|uniref:Uncharacterized protein n=1 Tax=Diversispora epigaea TaxID=1348612 RepID=A0A397I9P2_9GLOM|nr:hypothetical protein Glove_283g111 [Diversispora epigaea]
MTVDRTKELTSLDMKDMLPTSGRFIQLFKPSKESENNKNKFNNNNTTTDNLKMVQVLDATTEDPFTIESFDTLIQQHAEQGKNFILARVITSDPLDNTKMYQSHYSAHHINKVLFRTQPEQGLLHRMKAKNPLNNMNIMGDVHYYVVKAETVKLTPSVIKSSSKSTVSHVTLNFTENLTTVEISATSALDESRDKDLLIDDKNNNNNEDRDDNISIHSLPIRQINQTSDDVTILSEKFRWSADNSIQKPSKIFEPEHSNNIKKVKSFLSSPSFHLEKNLDIKTKESEIINLQNDNEVRLNIIDEENLNISSTTNHTTTMPTLQSSFKTSSSQKSNELESSIFYYKATYYGTDDDFLMKTRVRQYFKANALDPSDSQLFAINSSAQNLGETRTTGTFMTTRRHFNRLIPENGFLIDRIGDYNPNQLPQTSQSARNSWSRSFRNIRENKSLQWMILMYFIIGFLILYFILVRQYTWIVAFILMLFLLILFCVGNSVGILRR